MPNQLIEDFFDLLRLRVKPLAHYVYPRGQLALLIVLSGIAGSTTGKQVIPDATLHVISSVINHALAIWLESYFFRWWLRQGGRWSGTESLFPLIALTEGIVFFYPLLLLFPGDFAGILLLPFMVFKVFVTFTAISRATGVARGHVIGGMLLWFGVFILISLPFVLMQS